MMYKPGSEFTRAEIDKMVEQHATIFHADSRICIDPDNHVMLYCADYFGAKFFKDLGRFADPEQEVARIVQRSAWEGAKNSFSAASLVAAAIASTPKFQG